MDQKILNPFDLGRITLTYTECEHSAADNGLVIYDDYKISIHLTNGLYGVINNRLVGGERGDVSLYAPNEIHFGRFSVSGRYRFINLLLSKEFLARMECEDPSFSLLFSASPERTNCIRGSVEEKIRILELAESLAILAQSNEKNDDVKAFSLILSLLLQITALAKNPQRSPLIPLGNPMVGLAVEYITAHYGEKLTVKDLAKTVGCSAVYLSKIFRSYMGKSVYEYLTEYRVHQAASLLRSGCSVTDTCYLVGFSDCSGFIRTFRRIMTVTPYQYKQQISKGKQ